MRCPFRSVSIRPRLEISFEDRLQNELECPLNHTIADSRNRQDADFLAPVLRNLLLPSSHGPIRGFSQISSIRAGSDREAPPEPSMANPLGSLRPLPLSLPCQRLFLV